MKRCVVLLLALVPFVSVAQPKVKAKNYPSLLWEITGNGLKKPSYLFGTMHVSSKLAFHLADSFYLGIRNADVVALETNPESWQEDMSKYEIGYEDYNSYESRHLLAVPNEYLSINTLKFYRYDKKIERALYSNPSAINNLLYRSYGNETSDFEEDTYLDMYIYQCGKKWGKKVAGVEKYGESMKLMMEAYKDAARDRNTKERSYDGEEGFSAARLQEAYRSGNLDWLDSINRYNSFSAAFDEKFLYRRNEIQASSIDSILKSGQSLFVGVGAAHLPGERGVIEMLRREGYRLRPVKMGARDSQHKTQVEKARVAVTFTTQQADDAFYKVDIPGKFYKFGEDAGLDQRQYADMANGSYYMVTRIMTNAWMWGHDAGLVTKVIDSLLYENIPGKIISKTKILRNGYPGIDVINKTRRGDIQRYNIFVTPFEVIIFKMSGTGDYVKNGEEVKRFFGSIQLKDYRTANPTIASWKKYSPAWGGFSIDLPHEPYIGNDGSWIFDAADKTTSTQFRVIRTDIHNYHFAEEDSFDLNLMAESFEASGFIDKPVSRVLGTFKGYPSLDCRYRDKNGGVFLTRFIIQGPHYYTLVSYGKQEMPAQKKFLNSFEINPYQYRVSKERKDTSLYFRVVSPVFPESSKEKLDLPRSGYSGNSYEDEPLSETDRLQNGVYRSKIIGNDSTGEKIFVSFFKMSRYGYIKDSSVLEKENQFAFSDSSGIIRTRKKYDRPDKTRVWETVVTDTGSSRAIWTKTFYKNGIGYALMTLIDTLSQPGSFIQSFYDSFEPAGSLQGQDPFIKKSHLFFADLKSPDTIAHRRAVKNIPGLELDSSDLAPLKKAIASLDWKEKNYLEIKKDLIAKLDGIKTKASSDMLKELYYAAGDTLELQYRVLEVLLQQKTPYSFKLFRDIMLNEPPVLNTDKTPGYTYDYSNELNLLNGKYDYDNDNFMDELHDSLQLTATILTGLLPLMNLDDYKNGMMELLAEMVDSNLVQPKDYELYFSKFLIEAKQELKRQAIAEKQKAIAKAEQKKLESKLDFAGDKNGENSQGNEKLGLYTTLLLPWWDYNPSVAPLFNQVMASSDKRLKFNTLLLLLRNNKPFPDSLLNYYAAMSEFRYELYTGLKSMGKKEKFPARFNTPVQLAESKLMSEKSFDRPDSILYLDRLTAEIKGKRGFLYFFKYKVRKDDASWKLATVGLILENEEEFEFKTVGKKLNANVTGYTERKLREDEPLLNQLIKEKKRVLISLRKSAKGFYDKSGEENDDLTTGDGFEE